MMKQLNSINEGKPNNKNKLGPVNRQKQKQIKIAESDLKNLEEKCGELDCFIEQQSMPVPPAEPQVVSLLGPLGNNEHYVVDWWQLKMSKHYYERHGDRVRISFFTGKEKKLVSGDYLLRTSKQLILSN
jgi:hypothetical protein